MRPLAIAGKDRPETNTYARAYTEVHVPITCISSVRLIELWIGRSSKRVETQPVCKTDSMPRICRQPLHSPP